MQKIPLFSGFIALALCLPSHAVQFSSILPANRSVQVGSPASFFGTMLNTASVEAKDCAIFLASPIDAWFSYQATEAETNAPIGVINTPVSIPAGSSQSFVLTLTPNSVIAPIDVKFTYSCAGQRDVAEIDGINTLLFSASNEPVPDVIALASTVSGNGIAELVQGETGFFTLSSANLGISGTFDVIPRVTGVKAVNTTICQTDPITSICFAEPQQSVNVGIGNDETPTFALFLTAADLIELDAAANRIFVEFRDESGEVRGSTSVAVLSAQNAETSPQPPADPVVERIVRVTWQAPDQDNSLLSAYAIHFGARSGSYTNSVSVNPQEAGKDISVRTGPLFVSMTSESASGARSAFSPELEILIE